MSEMENQSGLSTEADDYVVPTTNTTNQPVAVQDQTGENSSDLVQDTANAVGGNAPSSLDCTNTLDNEQVSEIVDLTGEGVVECRETAEKIDDCVDLTGDLTDDAVEFITSGPETPASQSDTSVSISSEKSTPSRRIIEFDNLSTSSGSIKNTNFPTRFGISWKKGEKIEAMDFMRKWFPAKILEINEEDQQVLIHFDGWNRRYDEWIDMTSERIGPLVRHSERKDRHRKHKGDHRVGEQVMAKWTDCKMYPAKITALLSNGSYEVIFYDGFKKQVQPINLRTMPPEYKQSFQIQPVDDAVLKNVNLKFEDSVTPGSVCENDSTEKSQARRISDDGPKKTKDPTKRRSLDDMSNNDQIKKKFLSGGPSSSNYQKSSGEDEPICIPAYIKSEPMSTQTDYDTPKTESSKLVPMCVKLEVQPGVSVYSTAADHTQGPAVSYTSLSSFPPLVPAKAFVVEPDHNRYKCTYTDCNKAFRKKQLLDSHVKHYHIQGGGRMAPAQPKKRRKTISTCATELDGSHHKKSRKRRKLRHVSAESVFMTPIIKTEVPDVEARVQEQLPPKAATGLACSEESGIQRTSSAPADILPMMSTIKVEPEPTINAEIKTEIKTEPGPERTGSQDTLGTEESSVTDGEAEDYLKPDELVNCICDFYEENGLMIQCEVCMCWQHAACFGITDRTLPKTYVCFICENPPGVRESRHYIHEQEWFKSGELSSFNYLSTAGTSDEVKAAIKAANSAVADIHQLHTVLHTLRQQLKILRSKDESELKMWRLDWDFVETFDDPGDSSLQMEDNNNQSHDQSCVTQHMDQSKEMLHNMDQSKETLHSNSSLSCELSSEQLASTSDFDLSKSTKHSGMDLQDIQTATENKEKDTATNDQGVPQLTESTTSDQGVPQLTESTTSDQTVSKTSGPSDTCIETSTGDRGEPEQSDNQPERVVVPPAVAGEVLITAQGTEVVGEAVVKGSGTTGTEFPTIPLQPHVHFTLEEEANNSDSTESAVEDPIETYEKNLLQHIIRTQTEIDTRLQLIEEQVILLEELESRGQGKEGLQPHTALADLPRLRRTMHTLDTDLDKVKRMAIFH